MANLAELFRLSRSEEFLDFRVCNAGSCNSAFLNHEVLVLVSVSSTLVFAEVGESFFEDFGTFGLISIRWLDVDNDVVYVAHFGVELIKFLLLSVFGIDFLVGNFEVAFLEFGERFLNQVDCVDVVVGVDCLFVESVSLETTDNERLNLREFQRLFHLLFNLEELFAHRGNLFFVSTVVRRVVHHVVKLSRRFSTHLLSELHHLVVSTLSHHVFGEFVFAYFDSESVNFIVHEGFLHHRFEELFLENSVVDVLRVSLHLLSGLVVTILEFYDVDFLAAYRSHCTIVAED